MKSLRSYLTPDFWRFNLAFCVQYTYIDYNKLAMLGDTDEASVEEAFDFNETEHILQKHLSLLADMERLADMDTLSENENDRLILGTQFFTVYGLIVRRLLFQHSVDFTEAPENHRNIKNYNEFQKVYADTLAELVGNHISNVSKQVEEYDKEQAKAKKKSLKKQKGEGGQGKKVIKFPRLVLDGSPKGNDNGS